MNLKFNLIDGEYVAEFSATSNFNLHIEREESGYLSVKQRTTPEGKYDVINSARFPYNDLVVDIDFPGVVYPKYIQVISKVEPTRAEVHFAQAMEDYVDDMITNALNTPI